VKVPAKSLFGAIVLMASLAACQKKEQPAPLAPAPGAGMPMDATHGAPAAAPARKESTIVIPENLKGRWKAVRIAVVDLATQKETIHRVPVGADYPVPGTPLTLRVENLIPHFSMGGGVITSKSDQMENPAVQVHISEGGKEAFKGWMFAKFPDAHPINHPKYGLKLIDFVP
jgi:hypothetical protein